MFAERRIETSEIISIPVLDPEARAELNRKVRRVARYNPIDRNLFGRPVYLYIENKEVFGVTTFEPVGMAENIVAYSGFYTYHSSHNPHRSPKAHEEVLAQIPENLRDKIVAYEITSEEPTLVVDKTGKGYRKVELLLYSSTQK